MPTDIIARARRYAVAVTPTGEGFLAVVTVRPDLQGRGRSRDQAATRAYLALVAAITAGEPMPEPPQDAGTEPGPANGAPEGAATRMHRRIAAALFGARLFAAGPTAPPELN